jgi:hypothetical protein
MRLRASLLPRLVPALEILGAALVAVAIAWWAVVYGQVIANTGMAPHRTVACLLRTSDLCSLAMSLCTQWHFLGISRYSPELLWIGAAISLAALGSGLKYPRRTGA